MMTQPFPAPGPQQAEGERERRCNERKEREQEEEEGELPSSLIHGYIFFASSYLLLPFRSPLTHTHELCNKLLAGEVAHATILPEAIMEEFLLIT